MQARIEPGRLEWKALCRRPGMQRSELDVLLREVFTAVQKGGDSALLALTEKYDGVKLIDVKVALCGETAESIGLDSALKKAIDDAYDNIWKFHCRQADAGSMRVETSQGVVCWQEPRAIERVGLYVPGGSAPLISTMLMLGIPALLAGCKQIVVCTPPEKSGAINAAIRYAAAKCGVKTLYAVGGAQAIAAMTVGTETVPRVDKLFGPGNQYVTAAKEYAERYGVAKDMPAGPSEVLVLADGTARADFVAADLLSQAEHGPDSQVVLVTTSREIQNEVKSELKRQIRLLQRSEIAQQALQNSLSVYFSDMETAIDFANAYAPEHWIIQAADAELWAERVQNAGSVFIGPYTPESAGDYASGTNHTLPTAGWARSYSGICVQSFQKQVSFQAISKDGLTRLASTISTLADAEGLTAHARAVTIRTKASP